MYYKHVRGGKAFTEAEYHEMIEKKIEERLADEDELDDYLHSEYSVIEIFNFTDDDRARALREFKEDIRKRVEGYCSLAYHCFEGEPTNTRKVRITIKEYRTDIRELPESDFDGEDMLCSTLDRLRREYGEENDIVYVTDADTDKAYFEE